MQEPTNHRCSHGSKPCKLCRLFNSLSSLCLQVARRVRAHEQVAEGEQASGKRRAVRYQTCSRDDFVFLHPRSSLHSTAPEFVVYSQLISTAKRPYMAG